MATPLLIVGAATADGRGRFNLGKYTQSGETYRVSTTPDGRVLLSPSTAPFETGVEVA